MEWWRQGFRLDIRVRPMGVALALAYALACWFSRNLSMDQFYLPAGVRVAALLLFAPRYWGYLILGEYAYFAQLRLPMVERFGAAWVVLGSAFLMPVVALIVHKHRNLTRARLDVSLLSIALLAATTVTILNIGLSHLLWPVPRRNDVMIDAVRYIVGDFIGILTIAPLAMLWKHRKNVSVFKDPFSRHTVLCIAGLTALGVCASILPPEWWSVESSMRLLMVLPAIMLTCKHGWSGAALAVPALGLLVGLTTPSPFLWSFDESTFVTQQSLAITGCALLVLGYNISRYYQQYKQRATRDEAAIAYAKSSHISSEKNLRQRVLDMRRVGDGIDHSLSEIAYWLNKHGLRQFSEDLLRISVANSRKFREQTSMVYPTSLEHVGLYLALQVSGISDVWDETNRVALPRLGGDPCRLSVGLQLATYRVIAEAVSLLIRDESGQLVIKARCGQAGEHQGILVTVGLVDASRTLSALTTAEAVDCLTGRVLAYSGTVHCRGNRIRMLLVESATIDHGDAAMRIPAWEYGVPEGPA